MASFITQQNPLRPLHRYVITLRAVARFASLPRLCLYPKGALYAR